MYSIAYAIGANLIPMVFFVTAILLAKKSSTVAWILFTIGSGLDIISLIGRRRLSHLGGYYASGAFSTQLTVSWIVFIILAVLTIALMIKRKQ